MNDDTEAMVWACVSAGYFTWDSLTYLLYVVARRTDDVEVGEFVHAFVPFAPLFFVLSFCRGCVFVWGSNL
jgi:hypothetical protein